MTDEPTETYEIIRGTHRGRDGELYEAGDTVELTERQAAVFASEKFRKVDSGTDEEEDDGDEPSVDATIPDDYDDLQELAKTADTDEVNGVSSAEDIEEYLEGLDDDELIDLKFAAGLE